MSRIFKMFEAMDRRQKALVKGVLLFFIICIILVVVIGLFKNRKLSYGEIENRMLSSAKSYYNDNKEKLPQEIGGSVSVDSLTLVENGYMEEFEEYNKEVVACSGTVTVTNNNGHYLYLPDLKCEGYKTTTLYNKILDDQPIVTEQSGLYEINGEYVFRGEFPNNYVKFAGRIWRIIRLTSGNEIRLIGVDRYESKIWDDRYNINASGTTGITIYEISRIKEQLDTIYDTEFDNDEKVNIVSKQLCVGKRSSKEKNNSGEVECKTLTENTYPLGMIQVNEYMQASIDENCKIQENVSCTNYNYLANLEDNYWTITSSTENDYDVYYIADAVRTIDAAQYRGIRLTLNIDGNIIYKSGNGTEEDPYVIS